MKKECGNCRHRKRGSLQEPCSTGVYQLFYSHRCFMWKPEHWHRRAIKQIKIFNRKRDKVCRHGKGTAAEHQQNG